MFSKLLELTGLGLIAVGLAWAISKPAGLIFAGAAIVLLGSVTDDAAVGSALRRGVAWTRYLWWRQISQESGIPVPSLRSSKAMVPCDCGGNEDCAICGGSGLVPDPTLQVNKTSPHPPLKVDPQAEEFWSRMAVARRERAKVRDRTPALSRQDHQQNGDLERLG